MDKGGAKVKRGTPAPRGVIYCRIYIILHVRTALLTANSTSRLCTRHWISPQWRYMHCLNIKYQKNLWRQIGAGFVH